MLENVTQNIVSYIIKISWQIIKQKLTIGRLNMKRPEGIKLIIMLFSAILLYEIYMLIKPITICDSILFGRLWAFFWILLDGAIVFGLLFLVKWVIPLFTVSYILSILSSLFTFSLTGIILLLVFWTVIYVPCIKYLREPNIKALFLKRDENENEGISSAADSCR